MTVSPSQDPNQTSSPQGNVNLAQLVKNTKYWFDYSITNPHSSDDGVDIGTPDNTPVFFPYGGQVIDANYYTYGGQVVVFDGTGYDEYFIHLNKILVSKGENVSPGQEIGTTGGGVGDLLLKNGKVQPATSQADFLGASTGYHTEFGEFKDTSAHGDMGQFNEGWGGQGGKQNGRQLDPTSVLEALQQEQNTGSTSGGVPWWVQLVNNPALAGAQAVAADASAAKAAETAGASLTDPASWAPAIVSSLGFTSPGDLFARAAGLAGGMALIGLGVFVAFHSEIQQAATNVIDLGAKTAGTAAKAAAL